MKMRKNYNMQTEGKILNYELPEPEMDSTLRIPGRPDLDKADFKYFPKYNASFILVKDEKDLTEPIKFLVRMEEQKYRGLILEVSKVEILEDENRTLKFLYDIVYNPIDHKLSFKHIENFLNKCVRKVLEDTIKTTLKQEQEKLENRDADSKIITL